LLQQAKSQWDVLPNDQKLQNSEKAERTIKGEAASGQPRYEVHWDGWHKKWDRAVAARDVFEHTPESEDWMVSETAFTAAGLGLP
jgi:hypothetical protein